MCRTENRPRVDFLFRTDPSRKKEVMLANCGPQATCVATVPIIEVVKLVETEVVMIERSMMIAAWRVANGCWTPGDTLTDFLVTMF